MAVASTQLATPVKEVQSLLSPFSQRKRLDNVSIEKNLLQLPLPSSLQRLLIINYIPAKCTKRFHALLHQDRQPAKIRATNSIERADIVLFVAHFTNTIAKWFRNSGTFGLGE